MLLILYLTGVSPWLDSHYTLLAGVSQIWCCVLSASSGSHMICLSICPNIFGNFSHLDSVCQFLHCKVSIFFLIIFMYFVGEIPWDTHLLFLILSHFNFSIHQWFLTETVITMAVAKWYLNPLFLLHLFGILL